jgi:hypothetical protein
MSHNHKNFSYSTVAIAPFPALSGTTLSVQAGDGLKFPDVPFNATVWPTGVQPLSSNAEIIVVTDKHDDLFTIERTSEGSTARSIIIGDQIAATITAKTLTDAEDDLPFWSPFIMASGGGSGLQTLNNGTGSVGTGSLLVFPVTIPSNMVFNQIVILNSISLVTSANTANNQYHSKFGLYSMDRNTLTLITSNSFSIGETLSSRTCTWIYPTTTHTSVTTNGSAVGYGYGNFPAGVLTDSSQRSSYVIGNRSVGLQFATNVAITGGVYWLGMMSIRSTNNNGAHGISHMGLIGQPMNVINQAGSVNGLLPVGVAATEWTSKASNVTGWWGRHLAGFVTATSLAGFLGTGIPNYISLSELQAIVDVSRCTVLPSVTFVST